MADHKQNPQEDFQELIKVTMLLFDNFQTENQAMLRQMQGLGKEVRCTFSQSQTEISSTAAATQKALAKNIERIIDDKLECKMADLEKILRHPPTNWKTPLTIFPVNAAS